MKKPLNSKLFFFAAILLAFGAGLYLQQAMAHNRDLKLETNYPPQKINHTMENNMKVGAFSMSLSVKDLKVSKEFYENLGFTVFAGGMEKKYLIMKNGNALIGLFEGMFNGNILTFNPGWDENAQNLSSFDDVRSIQKKIKSKGIKLSSEADENSSGPASIMLSDPDGNIILFDQHR